MLNSTVSQDVHEADASSSGPSWVQWCEREGHGGHHTGTGSPCGDAGEPERSVTEQTQPGKAAHPGPWCTHTIQVQQRCVKWG